MRGMAVWIQYLFTGPRLSRTLALATGAIVVVSNGDLLILLSFQLALVETQGAFQNVFDLFSKKKK